MAKTIQDAYGEILRLRNEFYQKWQEVPHEVYDENRDAYKAKYEAFDKALELLTPSIVDERPEPISPADVGFEALGKAWDEEEKKVSDELTHSEVTKISDQEISIKPKFKIGDIICKKDNNDGYWKVEGIDEDKCEYNIRFIFIVNCLLFKDQDNWKIVEDVK